MKYLLSLCFVIVSFQLHAQDHGSIAGTLTDKEYNNEPLAFANVIIKGSSTGTTTNFDGLYAIDNLAPGKYQLSFSYLGYQTVEVNDVEVVSGKVTTINIPMAASEGMSLDEVVVTTIARRDSENALLLDQKKAVSLKTAIGAQELARKGVGDVATAVTKTTGISKQEGSGGVFVRGLGDRYNNTTLNGLPLPSNNPSRKNIDLEIFSTDIVEFIGIDKTYSTTNYGDFAGANIDIASKNYVGSGFLELGLATGANSEAAAASKFYLNQGPNYSGFYTKKYPAFPLNNYNFTSSWDRTSAPAPINASLSLKGGDSFSIGEDSRLNFFAVASFDNGYQLKEGINRGGVTVSGLSRKDLDFISYEYATNTTLMGNIGFKTAATSLKFNSLYINTSSQKQQEYYGVIDAFDYAPEGGAFLQRASFERTALLVNQLLGDHKLQDHIDLNWGVSYNTVDNNIPNRRQITLTPDDWDSPEGPKSFQQTLNTSDNHRFYQTLTENELAANIATSFKFNKNEEDDTYGGKLTLGYSGRLKTTDFEATQFNFRITKRDANGRLIDQPIVENMYDMDAYFNQDNLSKGLFSIETFRGNANNPIALAPQTYDGNQDIHAGFVSGEYQFSSKFTMIAGLRGEQINQTISWSTSLDPSGDTSTFDAFEILPMLSLKYELNEKQNLKFAASKTYTLPQFKERALFQFEEVTTTYRGNPSLYASTDYNLDLKWELFPKSDELISLGVFAKYIQNPINDININSATNDLSYVNTGDHAIAGGAEFELRKNIFEKEKDAGDYFLKDNLSIGFNASYMYSNQKLDADKVIRETTEAGFPLSVDFSVEEDKLTGASDLLFNADVSYFSEYAQNKNVQATLAYNYFSDRIFALGTEGKGNLVEKGMGSLDLIVKTKLNQNLSLGLSAKNLLNPAMERIQETQEITVLSYKKGSSVKLSLSYNF
ncbi:TonB-dependent receptor [Arenibacter sp. 6A1]|uniref:TonB-dependent receptor n=1 Tax=Arenibacter sp. 6A1 TaxID=2720391 RepID=UPI001445EBCD|nr:TonB-dependent receptor [Arenibacter sp. 6A1]NKI26140.1 TonB-dependent receptor [Arenibacter sp. 6A1]